MAAYLSSSTTDTYYPGAVDYAHQIAAHAKRRRVFDGIGKIFTEKRGTSETLEDILSLYQNEMSLTVKNPGVEFALQRLESHVLTNKKNGRMGFDTGFDLHRNIYATYVPGHTWVMGGFTSVGKTAVMIQKICNLITSGQNPAIVIISTEMTEEQVLSRIISNLTGVHSYAVLSGNFRSADEQESVDECKKSLASAKLLIYDNVYTLGDIETALRKADLQGGVDVAFVDYVQNVRVPDAKSQYQEQSEIAKRLQQLAKDVRATLICLSQVSNDVGRGNTDNLEFKGAGELAAVADYGIMLSRHKTEKQFLKYDIKKNRHGKLGAVALEYLKEFTSLSEANDVDIS